MLFDEEKFKKRNGWSVDMNRNEMLLTDYLSQNISKKEVYAVIFQIVDALLQAEGKNRQVRLVLDEMEYIEGKVKIEYNPGTVPGTIEIIAAFLKEVIFHCVFHFGEELEDLTDFLEFLDSGEDVTLPNIYSYIAGELEMEIPPERQKLFGGSDLGDAKTEEPYIQSAQGETGVLDVSFWQHNQVLKEADKIQNEKRNSKRNDETGLLDESYWDREIQQLNSKRLNNKSSACLVHIRSGQEIRIQKEVFVIGKDKAIADLVLSNKTISRKHAEIITKGTHYFLKDNNSTNQTFVGGKPIKPDTNVEIFSGSIIRFSNEEYRFMVK